MSSTPEYAKYGEAATRLGEIGSSPGGSRPLIETAILLRLIILELKAVSELAEEHRAQVQNYLKATRLKLGLLVNLLSSRGVNEHQATASAKFNATPIVKLLLLNGAPDKIAACPLKPFNGADGSSRTHPDASIARGVRCSGYSRYNYFIRTEHGLVHNGRCECLVHRR